MQALERDAGEAAAHARDAALRRRAELEAAAGPATAPAATSASGEADAELRAAFSRSDFDPIVFINQRFPTEHSLSAAEDVSAMLRGVTLKLEQDMQRAVREQATSKDRGQRELAAAKSATHGLFDRIEQIQTKARQTEATVEGICGGIRQLDAAKQNLTSTVTALRRLQMLVQAVDQLERSAGSRQYGTAPGLLDATNQLADHFERYREVPKIAELQHKIGGTVKVLRRQVLSDIKRVVGDHDRFFDDEATRSDTRYADVPALHHKALADACSVVDSLDAKCREELVTWFCHQQLQAYSMLFIEDNSLAQTEKRYSWMLRYLKSYDERYGEIFPAAWNVAHQLCLTFCQNTREQLGESTELSRARGGDANACDVEVLVRAVELAIEAERRLDEALERQDEAAAGSASRAGTGTKVLQADGSLAREPTVAPKRSSFAEDCPISAGFEGALLVVYIAKQVREFEALLASLHKGERWRVDGDDEEDTISPTGERTSFVLDSAKELVIAVKEAMQRCAALSVRETFLDLLRIFKDTFRLYAQSMLTAKLEAQPAARMLAGEVSIAGEERPAVAGGQQAEEADLDADEDSEGNGVHGGEVQHGQDSAAAAAAAAPTAEGGAAGSLTRGFSLNEYGSFFKTGMGSVKAQIGEKNADRFTAGFTMAIQSGKAAREGALWYSDRAKEVAVKGAAMQGGKTAALVAETLATSTMKAKDFEAARQLEPTVLGLACTTAEYCSATLGQLAESYRKRIAPALADQIDVEQEQEVFAGVVSEGIRLLVAHMELRAVPPLDVQMVGLAWDKPAPQAHAQESSSETPQKHSDYIGNVAHELADFAATERRLLSTAHYRYLCDKVVTALVARFLRSLYKCKPLHAGGVQQLVADCDHLENVLLAMHWMRPSDLTADGAFTASTDDDAQRGAVSGSFGRFVKREMRRPKAVLELLPVAPEALVERFIAAMPSGSLVDLQHVMELQGLPDVTRQELLATMKRLKQQGSE
jgi:hypothetical protein